MQNLDDLTPLGQAFARFKRAMVGVQRAWTASESRFELDRMIIDVWRWMDISLGPLDDLYGGEDHMLVPHALYAHANDEQQLLAHDVYKRTLALHRYLSVRRLPTLATQRLLDALAPFVTPADVACLREDIPDPVLASMVREYARGA